jgi:uncharacterized protein YbjT (DUF2867 family)
MYAITGATGNSGHVIVEKLLKAGKKVRAIGRSAENLKKLAALGAEPFVGSLEDRAAIAKAFAGVEGVYAMIPPVTGGEDYRAQQDRVSDSLSAAIAEAKVKHVVVLSSFGAGKTEGTGPVVGLHLLEEKLKRIAGLNVLNLRAGYFMENTLAQIGIIQTMGFAAGPLRADLKLPLIATRDIGAAAADALQRLDFNGSQVRELHGQRDVTMTEAAAIIGSGIGKPGLGYVHAPDDQVRAAMLGMGASANLIDLILEMAAALNRGHMAMLEKRTQQNTTPTSFETFVKEEFAPRFQGKPASA